MRYLAVFLPLAVWVVAFSTAPAAQNINWGSVLQQGVSEVLKSINTPGPTSPGSVYSAATPASSQVSQVASASEAGVDARIADMLGNPAEFRAFFNQLKRLVAVSDKNALATMMNYPLRVSDDSLNVSTPNDFVSNYDRIFTPDVVAAVNAQTYADLFVRDQGASVGGGEVWFTGVCLNDTCTQRTPKVISVFGR